MSELPQSPSISVPVQPYQVTDQVIVQVIVFMVALHGSLVLMARPTRRAVRIRCFRSWRFAEGGPLALRLFNFINR